MLHGGETAYIAAAASRGDAHIRPSLPTQMTKETGKRPAGAAAALHAVYGPRDIRVDHYEGIPRLGVAAADTSYATVRASFSPNRHSKQSSRAF